MITVLTTHHRPRRRSPNPYMLAAAAGIIGAAAVVTGFATAAGAAPREVVVLPPPPTSAAWKNVNVLIIAVDPADVRPGAVTGSSKSDGGAAIAPKGAAATGQAPAATGKAPALGALTAKAAPNTTVVAKRRPQGEPEEDIKMEPERRGTLAGGATATGGATSTGGAAAGGAAAGGAATPGSPAAPKAPAVIAPVAPFATVDDRPPSRSLSAAAPLRRSLLKSGCTDVLSTIADGPAVTRAVQNRRLTARVVTSIQNSTLRALNVKGIDDIPAARPAAVPSSDEINDARSRAVLAAARIGQALNYRAVIVYTVLPADAATKIQPAAMAQPVAGGVVPVPEATFQYSMIVVDAAHETGIIDQYTARGADDFAAHENAAGSAVATINAAVANWLPLTYTEREIAIGDHLGRARAMVAKGDPDGAHDEINQVLGLDPKRAEAQIMLGEILQSTDATAAAQAFRKAVEVNSGDGPTWAKASIAYTIGTSPDWPRALEAGRRALALNADSAALRTAMATAQFARADLFRNAERFENAEEAELDAKKHLDRALEQEPGDPTVARLIAARLVSQKLYKEAVQTLDRLALQYPKDAEIQRQYALALTGLGTRDEDAFVVWTRVWKMTGSVEVSMESKPYRHLAEGFDQRLSNIGKTAGQLSFGVSTGALPRESALLQLTRLKEDMQTALSAIRVIQPSDRVSSRAHNYRVFAADLMDQALQAHQVYLETGQDLYRGRALEMHRQAIEQLNTARTTTG